MPPPGRTGWPWTIEDGAQPFPAAERGAWPRISIVTPSFNQGAYIEETLRSVLLQGYPNLEYIVMDGGSTDETVEILHRYEPWLAHWQSASDAGQSDAIASGFERATGEVLAWLCSDDLYRPGALLFAARAFAEHRDAVLVCGETGLDQGAGWDDWMAMRYANWRPTHPRLVACGQCVQQPGCFWRADAYRRTSGMDRSLRFAMDYDILLKLCAAGEAVFAPSQEVAWMRSHAGSKSSTMHAVRVSERQAIVQRAMTEHPMPAWRLCLLSYGHVLRTVARSRHLSVWTRARRMARIALGLSWHAVRGDVARWHPSRGYRAAEPA